MSNLQQAYVDGRPCFLVHKIASDDFITGEVEHRYGEGHRWEAVEEGFTLLRTDEVEERLTEGETE